MRQLTRSTFGCSDKASGNSLGTCDRRAYQHGVGSQPKSFADILRLLNVSFSDDGNLQMRDQGFQQGP